MKDIRKQIRHNDLASAERSCRQALAAEPDDISANFFLGFVLWRKGETQAALEYSRKALLLKPTDAGLLSDLGNLLRELGAGVDALAALDASLQFRPGHTGTLYNRALVLDTLGREREALDLLGTIAPGDRMHVQARYLGGTIRQDLGDLSGAAKDFQACIDADPDHAAAWHALVTTRRFTRDEGMIERLERQIGQSGTDRGARVRYLFALAKLNDDIGEYEAAGEYLLQANCLVNARYDKKTIEARLHNIIENFDAPPPGPDGETGRPSPVFIVGLPRSGTTLVETQLERHPDITALGELDTLPNLVSDFSRPPDATELHALGLQYLANLPAEANRTMLVLDKMPENFWRLGHIAWMLPFAKIVYCRRDERDVALSNFFNLYAKGNNFTYSLANLAHYTACHRAVMRHWLILMPKRIFRIDYDQLVTRPRESMEDLMDFLGLDWSDASSDEALQPTRRIRTASNWQVRQPIYASSIGRWKHYPGLMQTFSEHYWNYRQSIMQA